MLQRDLLIAEIEKLAQVLAKILRLRTEGLTIKADQLLEDILSKHFGLSLEQIRDSNISAFTEWLKNEPNLNSSKLESLSELLYQEFNTTSNSTKLALAKRLNLIYSELTQTHKILHLINISRQAEIKKYIE